MTFKNPSMLLLGMNSETYEALQKKHHLPAFTEIDAFFEISELEEPPFPLREMRRKIHDIVGHYTQVLEELLHPETSSTMHEVASLNDADREDILMLYKELRKLERKALEVSFSFDEKEDVAYILHAFKIWKGLVGKLRSVAQKLTQSWDVDIPVDKDNGYFG